jgi:addiction module RelE/StbE family toxin
VASMKINYSPKFTRSYRKLPNSIKDSFDDKIKCFTKNPKDPTLHVHKLKGKLESCLSFSLRGGFRILFEYQEKNTINLIDVGPHDWYRR